MELGTIRQINIDTEMQASYLDYAMSVIVSRALPDVRDGLKPVHRRILYAMHDLGLDHDKPYKKSARIVGEVLGKYHPHGDAAVYEAMVRMAQDFSLRYPLVDGQGNFGSIDGDNAAAMRYTEARLACIAGEMLADIEKDTVDWADNFDGTLKEPAVLPSALPNLLVNGSSGIAVGMATNIPPHNLGEVCDALCYLIDNYDRHDDVTQEDLTRFIPGPDFPTGGVVYRYGAEGASDVTEKVDVIARAYASGKGTIVLQAKAHIEEMSRSKNRIVVTELPYQANKSNLIERIAELVRDGRIEGITDLRDESDRTGMRICIELTRTVDPRGVLADLFRLTPLQTTFGMSLLALVADENGRLEPRLLSLKRLLLHYIEHRQEVIVRRSKHDLARAKQRAHILEGLLRALDVLDEVIALIRSSRTADTAKQNLIDRFKFTEIQAQAILDMQLRRLAALERRKLQDEYRETVALIRELEALLASPKKVLALIKQNLVDLKARYGDARRTQIAERAHGTLTTHDLLPDEDVWVTLGVDGMLSRQSRGTASQGPARSGSSVMLLTTANTRDDLYLFSAKGQATRVGVHEISESGVHFADISGLSRRDRIVSVRALPKPAGDAPLPGFLLLATVQGKVKRVALADLFDQASTNPQVIGLDERDELLWADVSPGGGEFLLITSYGQAIRFAEDEVRPMGLAAGGIGGIKLSARDRVVAAAAINQETFQPGGASFLAIVTTLGFGKRVPLADFPSQGRNGQGVVAAKPSPKSGTVAGAALIGAGDSLLCLTSAGGSRLIPGAAVPELGRPAQGKSVLPLVAGDQVTRISGLRLGGDTVREAAGPEAPAKAKATGKRASPSARAPSGRATGGATPPEPKAAARARPKTEEARARGKASAAKPEIGGQTRPTEPEATPAAQAKRRKVTPPTPATEPTTRSRKGTAEQPALLPSEPQAPAARKRTATTAKPAAAPQAAAKGESDKPVRARGATQRAPGSDAGKPAARSDRAPTPAEVKAEQPGSRPARKGSKTGPASAPVQPGVETGATRPRTKPAARGPSDGAADEAPPKRSRSTGKGKQTNG